MEVNPIISLLVVLAVMAIRHIAPRVADSRPASIGLAVAIGALTAFAHAVGLPIEEHTILEGVGSALVGIGGVETAKLSYKFRKLNKSRGVVHAMPGKAHRAARR